MSPQQFPEPIMCALFTTLAMTLAWVAPVAGIFLLDSFTGPFSTTIMRLPLFIIGGTTAGLIVGWGHWLALREMVDWARLWFRATVVSWAFAAAAWWVEYMILGGSHFEISQEAIAPAILITGAISGLVIGASQWLMLRKAMRVSPFWIVATTGIWLIATTISAVISTKFDSGIFSSLVLLVALGMMVGFGTGLARPALVGDSSR
jgi:hypothetical protein